MPIWLYLRQLVVIGGQGDCPPITTAFHRNSPHFPPQFSLLIQWCIGSVWERFSVTKRPLKLAVVAARWMTQAERTELPLRKRLPTLGEGSYCLQWSSTASGSSQCHLLSAARASSLRKNSTDVSACHATRPKGRMHSTHMMSAGWDDLRILRMAAVARRRSSFLRELGTGRVFPSFVSAALRIPYLSRIRIDD